jgi:hypothetical protein
VFLKIAEIQAIGGSTRDAIAKPERKLRSVYDLSYFHIDKKWQGATMFTMEWHFPLQISAEENVTVR